ncbi:MAG: hypothetical protein HYR63_22275 [Proteobacteria bacterium]|nr:hypothetical protein [Pseudomonadota bacterium]MBI3497575.1 hypothetical protein [Pseudomonadota bacterium]
MGRCLLMALLLALLGTPAALGQAPPAQPPRPGQAAPLRTGECALLPGGKAPVAHIADVATPLSPRSLDLIYFGKRLVDLTEADFQRIGELSQKCGPGEGILSEEKLQKLLSVVREAQKTRGGTIAWAKQRMAEVEALPVGRARLTRLNELWTELSLHESQMTREDVDGFAAWIAREQQALYDAAPGQRPAQRATLPPTAPPTAAQTGAGQPAAALQAAPGPAGPPPPARPRKPGGEEG